MNGESQDQDREHDEKSPAREDLQEPSTEKEPGREPKASEGGDPEPSHEAVGIGVVGGPLVDPEQPPERD